MSRRLVGRIVGPRAAEDDRGQIGTDVAGAPRAPDAHGAGGDVDLHAVGPLAGYLAADEAKHALGQPAVILPALVLGS